MKNTIFIILIAFLAVGNLSLLVRLKGSDEALADAKNQLNSILLHTAQVKILDEVTKEPIAGLSVSYPSLPILSSKVEEVSEQQYTIMFQGDNMNVLSRIGAEPIILKMEAPGYETKEVETSALSNETGVIEILMKKNPQPST